MEKTGPSLASRALAALVLLIAAWVLLKVVIGLVAWVAGFVVIAVAVIAVIWAVRVLTQAAAVVVYLTICLFFGLAGGVVGRLKGSSFFLWFVISAAVPVLGLLTAVLYRFETEELRRECPSCGRVCMLYDAVCMRCGADLEFPDVAIPPEAEASRPAPANG